MPSRSGRLLQLPISRFIRDLRGVPAAIAMIWRVAPYAVLVLLVCQLVAGLAPVGFAWVTKTVLDSVAGGTATTEFLVLIIFAYVAVAVMSMMAARVSAFNSRVTRDKLTHTLRCQVDEQTASLDLAFFEVPENQDALARAKREINVRPFMVINSLLILTSSIITALGYAAAVIAYRPLLLVAFVIALLPGLFFQHGGTSAMIRMHDSMTPDGRRATYFDELLTSEVYAKEVRLNALGSTIVDWNRKYTQSILSRLRSAAFVREKGLGVAALVGALSQSIAVGWAIVDVSFGNISVGTFTLLLAAFAALGSSVSAALGATSDVYEGGMFYASMMDFMSLRPDIRSPERPAPVPECAHPTIRLEGVTFRYPGSNAPVLSNFDLEIKGGSSTALVGVNGAGKTTIVKLISRLYDPQEGRVTYEGVDVREFSLEAYRSKISTILQDFARYQLTVTENVGRVGVTDPTQDVIQAADAAGAREVVDSLPLGWGTQLGKKFDSAGVDLSGGQWQRIALARALAKSTPLLILDEPTSALDADSEAKVFDHYRELASHGTSLLISHRLNMVREADEIIVLSDGEICERGDHERLMALDGIYRKLFDAQSSAYLR